MFCTALRLLAFSLMTALFAHAQMGRGLISGNVSDTSGASVPSATVVIQNTATNAVFRIQSNESGLFFSPPLVVGPYQVTVEKSGFKKVQRPGLILSVDQTMDLRITLEIGDITESVNVVSEAPLLNTTSASIGTVVENKRITELPVNGRNAMAFVLLTPGVRSNAGGNESGFGDRGSNLAAVSINGAPQTMNNFQVDGNQANNNYFPDLNVNPSVDSIEEFKVQTGTMSAEYGFTAGGVINVTTKSGTNQFHGSAIYFLRNDAFDARNTFAPTVAPFRYHQYGGSIGGPVTLPKLYRGKDRTFFFFNTEQWTNKRFGFPIMSVPTQEWKSGNFSRLLDGRGQLIQLFDPATTRANPSGSGVVRDSFPGNRIPSSRFDRVSNNILAFYPDPNKAPTDPFTEANNYQNGVQGVRTMSQYTVRGDHRFTDKNSMYMRYMYYLHTDDFGSANAYPNPVVRNRFDNFENHNAVVNDVHVFSSRLVNEVRVGVARQQFPFRVASFGGDWPQKLGLPASVPNFVFPQINNGFAGFNTNVVGFRGATTIQLYDLASYVVGKHTLKFGTEIRYQQANNLQFQAPSGNFNFGGGLTGNPQTPAGTGYGFATFLLGQVSSANVTTHTGESALGNSYSFFFQDDWRVSRRLTVNLGLRYDLQQWPYERRNGYSSFNPNARDELSGLMGRMEYAGKDYEKRGIPLMKDALGPRIGFAYDVTGRGTTIFRGGYGVYYPSNFSWFFFGSTAGFASTGTTYVSPGNDPNRAAFQFQAGFPTLPLQSLGAALGPSAFLGQGAATEERNKRVPRSQMFNASLQQQYRGWVFEAAYSANRGVHLPANGWDINQLDMDAYKLGLALQDPVANPYAGIVPGALGAATVNRAQALRPFPYYLSIGTVNSHLGNSTYHGGFFTVQRRFSSGFGFLASLTLGKGINDSTAAPIGVNPATGYQNPRHDRRSERSIDPTDVSRRLVISGVYELPIGKGKLWSTNNPVLERLIGGWQLNGILTGQSGNPVRVTGANNFLANRPDSTGASAKLDNPTRDRWFRPDVFSNPAIYTFGNLGRVLPDVRAPGIFNLDASIAKNTRISERFVLQLRGEAFNLTNKVNLGAPNGNFSPGPDLLNRNADMGRILSARESRSLQVGARLIF